MLFILRSCLFMHDIIYHFPPKKNVPFSYLSLFLDQGWSHLFRLQTTHKIIRSKWFTCMKKKKVNYLCMYWVYFIYVCVPCIMAWTLIAQFFSKHLWSLAYSMTCTEWSQPGFNSLSRDCWSLASSQISNGHQSWRNCTWNK